MTEQTPEIVAAADVSPVSPKPIHTAATSPNLVPSLQDHAATLDVAYLDSLTTAPFPFVTMPAAPSANPAASTGDHVQSSSVPETIVVPGDESSDASRGDEPDSIDRESLDAYGEEDDEQQGEAGSVGSPSSPVQHVAEAGSGAGTGSETPAAQPDVTQASSESMINTPSATSSPDSSVLMKSESPAAVPSLSAEPQTAVESAEAQPTDSPDVAAHPKSESQAVVDAAAAAAAAAAPGVAAAAANTAADEQKEDSVAVEIQKLVDDMTANAVASSITATFQAPAEATAASSTLPVAASISLTPSSSLPPKPAISQLAGHPGSRPEDFHPFQSRGPNSSSHGPSLMSMQGVVRPQPAPHGNAPYMTTSAAPGTSSDAVTSLPPPPPTSFNGSAQPYASLPNVLAIPGSSHSQGDGLGGAQLQQAWEIFQADEKRYMTEAKWERFPENSRIFIGNLSSERVSKREVFDLFHRFGRLAQISLKSAYGFVQYHTAEDAEAAMQSAQGAELGGRKIHLEFSRTQKKKEPQERDRERSPDRRNQRGGGGLGRGGVDRYDGREQGRRVRDDYRPGRSPSPRRDDTYGRGGRDRHHSGPYDRSSRARSRSRSPYRFGRYEQDSYRRRSPSPRRRGPPEPSLDIPQRYGDQVPDVQLLLLEEVQRDFVGWVQRSFYERGLKADAMFFNPRFSRDAVLQKLVVEGVHGVIELDLRAQTAGKVPLQVFDRSAGSNVRFDQYQDLDPKVAAELVLRTKQTHAAALQQPPAYSTYPPNPYPQYPQAYPPPQGPPAGYPYAQAPPAAPPAPALSVQDIAGMAGHIDNNTLQALLASLSASQGGGGAPPTAPVDINALLGNIQGAAAGAAPPQAPAPPYGYMPPTNGAPMAPPGAGHVPPGAPGANGADTAQQVHNIMATLARHR